MNNNDVIRRLRYIFNYNDSKMISLFALADCKISREQISAFLKKDDDPSFKPCSDLYLATFLDGFIIDKRGKQDAPPNIPEKKLNNNIVFRKLRIALNLKADDILGIMNLAGLYVSKHELSSFFRKPNNRNYRECKNQILRNFLKGLQIKYRK